MFWVVVITMEIEVCCEIGRRQLNYGNRQRSLGPAGRIFKKGEDWKKAKLHYEVAAMAGHELARYNLGYIDFLSGKKERASKHMKLAASAGVYRAMNNLLVVDFKQDLISRDEIDSILTA
jgi:TPR repeat protein